MAKKFIPNTLLTIIDNLGTIEPNIEVNMVGLENDDNKYIDIRQWSSDHKKCTYGLSLTTDQAYDLFNILSEMFFYDDDDNLSDYDDFSDYDNNNFSEQPLLPDSHLYKKDPPLS